ncbi:hypothetical protein [Streptomyces sp. NPDC060031]|uniref:hypothetical protein n=1 Tax=Streptomyces sp. NPDC060031 TaxID=3347043 RepID=UPI0036ACDE5A
MGDALGVEGDEDADEGPVVVENDVLGLPAKSWQTGESFYDTSATAVAASGQCQTFWYLTFTNAPYSAAVTSASMNEVR